MKLHMGCGSVYLEGYVNVDVRTPNTFLAKDRPDLVARWQTDESDYYRHHRDKTVDSLRAGPLNQEYVCDFYGTFAALPPTIHRVDEVLARHCFEHLSLTEARAALNKLADIIRPGGLLRLDVPDHEETLRLYKETGDEFYVRHLLGPRRGEYGFHMLSYTPGRLRSIVEEHDFAFVEEEPNIHIYPAFCLRFERA